MNFKSAIDPVARHDGALVAFDRGLGDRQTDSAAGSRLAPLRTEADEWMKNRLQAG